MSDENGSSLSLKGSPEELAEKFHSLSSPRDVARLLELDYAVLVYYLYRLAEARRYDVFTIKKRRGNSVRTISAPAKSLKIIQWKLAEVLSAVYIPKASVHGFCSGRSILTNAKRHVNQRYVLNLDLADFFPSINFGRVRGMFMATPYMLNDKVATVLAQICCFKNELPQGAPTSPVVSNMICGKMDSQLRMLAQRNRCMYTRYADDITFSTSAPRFPIQLASVVVGDEGNLVQLGDQLTNVIESNGFEVNRDKVRLQTRSDRQEVTGLVTNEFVNVRRKYIRQVRAMLHAWQRYGLQKAEQEHIEKYRNQDRSPQKEATERKLSFRNILLGKIEFIGAMRGKTDFMYINLLNKLIALLPDLEKRKKRMTALFIGPAPLLRVATEGASDWMHMKSALAALTGAGEYGGLSVQLLEYDETMGDKKLLSICKSYSTIPPEGSTIYVFVFDRDNPAIVREVDDGKTFKKWSDNVYSFSIPVPPHRGGTPDISMEFYYRDSEIQRYDSERRRLFINKEFSKVSHRHNDLPLVCTDRTKVESVGICIIDHDVFDIDDKNVALPKKKFAEYVLSRVLGFDNFDFASFRAIMDNLVRILQTKRNP